MKKKTILQNSKKIGAFWRKAFSTKNTLILNAGCLLGMLFLLDTAGFAQKKSGLPGNCRPGVSKASILSALKVDGKLRIGTLEVSFNCAAGVSKDLASEYVNFEPYQGPKFVTDLKNSRGTVINSFAWYGRGDYFRGVQMSRYEIVGGNEALRELAAGDYTLEFSLDNKVFQTFPFSVITKQSSDIYRPGLIYLLEGGWRDEAILESTGCLNFRLRANYELAAAKPTPVSYSLRVVREKDKKLIAEDWGGKLILENFWKFYRVCLNRPDRETTGDFTTLKLKEIAAVEGIYLLNLSYDGKPYATYKLIVKNGKINGEELAEKSNARFTLPATILRK
jgi:hypothetical protein